VTLLVTWRVTCCGRADGSVARLPGVSAGDRPGGRGAPRAEPGRARLV